MAKNTKPRPAKVSPETTTVGTPESPRIAPRVRRREPVNASLLASDTGEPPPRKSQEPSLGGKRSKLDNKFAVPAKMQGSPRSATMDDPAAPSDDTFDTGNTLVFLDYRIEAGLKQLTRGLEAMTASISLLGGVIDPRRRRTKFAPGVVPARALIHWASQIDSALGSKRERNDQECRFLDAIHDLCGQVRRTQLLKQEATDALIVPASNQPGGAKR